MPESLNAGCHPAFAGTCNIRISRENVDAGWQIPVGLALYKAEQKDLLNEGFGGWIMVPW